MTSPHFRRSLRVVFGFVAMALVACASTPASAIDMASHRAIYGMKLHAAHSGSGITGARGRMVYSFRGACEGWSSETSVKLQLLYSEGDQVDTEWAFASWEARDGKSYQFSTRQVRNGQLVESLKGSVERKAPGDAAEAKFTDPEDKEIELPKGTLFPTEHLADLLKAGAAGRKIYSRVVFDGASLENPHRINAVVSQRSPLSKGQAAPLEKAIKAGGLKDAPIQHYRMAFFGLRSVKEQPDFELGVDYRPDGVSRFIRQDFGDFVVDLTLEKIELFKNSGC